MPPAIHYARNGDVSIAYQVFGDGPVDLLMVPGWVSHLLIEWDEPSVARFLERIGTFARVVRFDKRGTGLSDRPPGVATAEERMEDTHAVMDAVGIERAAVWGWSEGGPLAILFAATYPERTSHLVLYGTRAAIRGDRDGIQSESDERFESHVRHIEDTWAREPNVFRSPNADTSYRAWLLRFQPASASPAAAAALLRANRQLDVRALLSAVHVPTLVVSRRDDPIGPEAVMRSMAERIDGAKFVVLDGSDHAMWLGDAEALVGAVEEFLTGERGVAPTDRLLATILIMDIERSTEHLARLGDARWRDALADLHKIIRSQLSVHRGNEVDMVGDQLMASFDGPVRAIRCAKAIQREASGFGIALRAGVHTGEVERSGDSLRGFTIHVTARIAATARGGEVVISDTTRDIVAGSGLSFDDRGPTALKGIPEPRRLFAVV